MKVKGHATWRDVNMERVTLFNKVGNAKADTLAREVHKSARRRRLARDYHKIIHGILCERERALAALPPNLTETPASSVMRRLAFAGP